MKPSRIRTILEMIKFEHSVFALPFALTGALLAARYAQLLAWHPGWPSWRQIAWIIVAMVGARSCGHDHESHRRSALRSRKSPHAHARARHRCALGRLRMGLHCCSRGCSRLCGVAIEPLALELSPVALAVLFFYSYTKRFTSWSHLVLGFCLGMSPAAAWIAIAGSLDARMLILCAAVTLWVGGFDVLYACQDLEYDNRSSSFPFPSALASRGLW